jgi:hypothetical protein
MSKGTAEKNISFVKRAEQITGVYQAGLSVM